MEKHTVIIVGGGAAGFFAAITAKTQNPALKIIILEAGSRCLSKVKISGGGRCNVTHACFEPNQLVTYYPRGSKELKSVFSRFQPKDTVKWFESHGVKLKTESDGRMFPVTDDSQTIIDCLMREAKRLNILIYTKARVDSVEKNNEHFVVKTADESFQAYAVVLATGSNPKAYAWAKQLGHTIIPPVPSLFTFDIKHPLLADLAGISFPSVKATLKVPDEKPVVQSGPLLITHWGLSGPVVLRLSAWGARQLHAHQYKGQLLVDFFPEIKLDSLLELFQNAKEAHSKKQINNFCPVDLPKRFWHQLLSVNGVAENTIWAGLSKKQITMLCEGLKNAAFSITSKGVFKEEFVTAGGVSLKEIDFKTMESRLAPGLYLIGEIIDIDGLTGGFNFQNAWSGGWLSGSSIASHFLL